MTPATTATSPRWQRASDLEGLDRASVEDFLFGEAALLDEWRLDDWLSLLTDDARYEIPPTDHPTGSSTETLYLVADDRFRIESRVKRLKSDNAHAEFPHSRTRRMITNVRLGEIDEAGHLPVTSSFTVYRIKYEHRDSYVGQYEHRLVVTDGLIRIAQKRAVLDDLALRPLGLVSIIL